MIKIRITFVALIILSSLLPGRLLATTEKRTALIIGNSKYIDAPLKNPVNDANDMATVLEQLGFNVSLRVNATKRTMEESIRTFGTQLQSGSMGLFYFAGHGIQYRGRNYLIPVHAEIKSEADVAYEAVDAGRILSQMENAGNELNIIILDACRNNPFARSFRSANKGLTKMDAPTGSILAYSTAPGSVAADGTGRNGLYTEYLLKHMRKPGTTVERMFKLVRRDVTGNSNKEQVPWESSSLIGDFFFVPQRGITIQEKFDNSSTASFPDKVTPNQPVSNKVALAPRPNHKPKDYQASLMLPKKLGITSVNELDGAAICILPGSSAEVRVANYFRRHQMKFNPVVLSSPAELEKAFFAGRCDCMAGNYKNLAQSRAISPNPSSYKILPFDEP